MGLGNDTLEKPLSVITGATSGLGAALVDCCARAGHLIIGVGRQEKELALMTERAKALGAASIVPVRADLSTLDGRATVINAAANIPNNRRYLFNIAGTYVSDTTIKADPQERESLYAIKAGAANDLLRAPYPKLFIGGKAFQVLPWTSVVYSGSQAQLIELHNSSEYARANNLGTLSHLVARLAVGVDAKTVYFGNLEGATADSFNLGKDEIVPIKVAANEMLAAALDPSLIAAIVLPRVKDAPAGECVQKRELRTGEYALESDQMLMLYEGLLHERFSSMVLPKFG